MFPKTRTPAQIEAKAAQDKVDGFDKLMRRPEVKLLASMVPATEPAEVLQMLLRAAFETGFEEGQASVVVSLAESILATPRHGI